MKKILLAEDEQCLTQLLSSVLSNYSLVCAVDGLEAISLVHSESDIMLYLLDCNLPKLCGVSVYYEVRAVNSYVPIVLTSGYLALQFDVPWESDSNLYFLPKPFRIDKLKELVIKLIGVGN